MVSPMPNWFVAQSPNVVPLPFETPRLKPPPPFVRMLILVPKLTPVPVVNPASVPSLLKEVPRLSTRTANEKKTSPLVRFVPSGRRRLMDEPLHVSRFPAAGERPDTSRLPVSIVALVPLFNNQPPGPARPE